jgi:hypothetical protein
LVAAFRCALEKNPRETLRLLERHDQPNRELLFALMQLTAGVGAGKPLSPQELAATLDQLQSLSILLRRRAALKLDKVCFCRRIDQFGQFQPLLPDHEFQAGVGGRPGERVQVYAEVRNFSSQLRVPPAGQTSPVRDVPVYESILASTLEIYDYQRRHVVPAMNLRTCVDRSQTPRQDYFLNFQFHVPARLAPGSYTLRITVKDITPGQPSTSVPPRVAQRSLDFKVIAPGSRRSPL